MSASFEWIDSTEAAADDYKILLQESLNEHRAKRRNLDLKIENMMYLIREMEVKRDAICEKEDQLSDELQRIRKLKTQQI